MIKSRPLQRATIERSKSINIDDCIEMPNLEKKREDKRRGNHKESVWSRMSEGRDSFLAARSAS